MSTKTYKINIQINQTNKSICDLSVRIILIDIDYVLTLIRNAPFQLFKI